MNLADIIIRIESSGGQYAQRIEKLHIGSSGDALINAIVKSHGNRITRATADIYAAMSHGFFQIMGFRLWGDPTRDPRNLGHTGTLWSFLNSEQLQRENFMRYCTANDIAFTVEQLETDRAVREKFARVYNGPGNVAEYSARILKTINELKATDRAGATGSSGATGT